MLRRPSYPATLENRKEIIKHFSNLLKTNLIRNTGQNDIVEIPIPILITSHDVKFRFCGYFRALNTYTKAFRFPIPRIPHSLNKLEKSKYIKKMDWMKDFHQN
ncbi:hypothetical protein O181_037051 [Austropuccinia psidii MF-1]|uniref:Uncharacterized protein n=1 Tax=Austropuccinia psidii MF-1 TaxID=1389203 RepID=A0A9Q3HAF4_9BASI|nr:hypothetical protein [Austropuccinia psidii MF-1]